ncbi:MAG: hypothetical protein ACLFP2_03360 [Candidatus Woesearchaeota archaeon]
MKKALIILAVLALSVYGLYEEHEDRLFNDGNTDSWYADTTENRQFDRWNYDVDQDGVVDYFQYDLDGDCYAEYTTRTYPDARQTVNHWYADTNEDGLYDRKNYDTNDDGIADVYTYDRDFDGVFEAIYVDSDFSYLTPNPDNETFDEWYNDTDGDGVMDVCRYDQNGDNMFSYDDDLEVVGEGCYNYSFDIPNTTNIVYNRYNWPCTYSSGQEESALMYDNIGVSHFNTLGGELEPVAPGDIVDVRISFGNTGDIDYEDTSVRVSIPEIGLIAPKRWVRDFDIGDEETYIYPLEIPEYAESGEYGMRLDIWTSTKHRTVYRPLIIS